MNAMKKAMRWGSLLTAAVLLCSCRVGMLTGKAGRPEKVKVLVVPTNEEKTIARDVVRVLNNIMPTWEPPETVTP